MPFYCGYCSRWVESKHQFCPTCGRPQRGRMCRRCKKKVPTNATHCPSCGGDDRLTEPAVKGLRLNWKVKLALFAGAIPLGWLVIHLVTPVLYRLVLWLEHLAANVLIYTALFWILTACLPRSLGQKVRTVTWSIVRQIGRILGNLLP